MYRCFAGVLGIVRLDAFRVAVGERRGLDEGAAGFSGDGGVDDGSPRRRVLKTSAPILNSRTRRALPDPECWLPCPVVWLVVCHSARVPISFASQSRDSGAVWRCATTPAKLSVRLASSPGCLVRASMSAADWVMTMTCPPWERPRCRIATCPVPLASLPAGDPLAQSLFPRDGRACCEVLRLRLEILSQWTRGGRAARL